MPDAAGSVTHFFEQQRAGNRDAVGQFCQRFLQRLIALANKTPEHAVQAARIDSRQQFERGQILGDMRRQNQGAVARLFDFAMAARAKKFAANGPRANGLRSCVAPEQEERIC